MRIVDLFGAGAPVISFEFFPPKTEEGVETLYRTVKELRPCRPSFVSVTYGAGGSTQARTFDTVKTVRRSGVSTAPHLSCIGSEKGALRELLQTYREDGVDSLVALRGDLPSGMGGAGELRYANELVEFIRAETGDHFEIAVAAYPEAHPQAPSFERDLENFARKAKAGADLAITQYFFTADAYFHFVDRVRAILTEEASAASYVTSWPKAVVLFEEMGDSALLFKVLAWLDHPRNRQLAIDALNTRIYKRLQAEGIEIPYPKRDVYMHEAPKKET